MNTVSFLLLLALFLMFLPSILVGFCKLMDAWENNQVEISADITKIPLEKRDEVAYYEGGFWRWKNGR